MQFRDLSIDSVLEICGNARESDDILGILGLEFFINDNKEC